LRSNDIAGTPLAEDRVDWPFPAIVLMIPFGVTLRTRLSAMYTLPCVSAATPRGAINCAPWRRGRRHRRSRQGRGHGRAFALARLSRSVRRRGRGRLESVDWQL